MSFSSIRKAHCKFLNDSDCNASLHIQHRDYEPNAKVYNNILEAIGHTPLVRLNSIPKSYGLNCEILVKCEFMNPGGSIKDRVSLRMVEDAERCNMIKPGYTLIEATSGNTGVGLSLAAAVKGYKMIITLPEKMSQEKVNVMKGLGAEVIRTPTEAASSSPESNFSLARRLRDELANSAILDQFSNSSNPMAHYDYTGKEIIEQCQGKLDYFFAGAGTGGTITGCAARLKEFIPDVKCIGVDPVGSVMAEPADLNTVKKPYHIEGIGYDFIPNTLVRSFVDEWVKVDDQEAFDMARRLIREEGLLVGGSSGTAVAGAIQYALKHKLNENHRLVVILPDSIRNYINKFLDDDWMADKGLLNSEMYLNKKSKLYGKKVRDLNLPSVRTYKKSLTIGGANDIFEKGGEVIPILEDKTVKGVIYANKFAGQVETKNLEDFDIVERCVTKDFVLVDLDTDLTIVQKFLERHQFVLAEEKSRDCEEAPKIHIVSSKDLFKVRRNMKNQDTSNS